MNDGAEPDPRWPVSVKGVILDGDQVVLLRNERDEWELPGGRLEPGEAIEECLVREVREELGIVVSVGPLLDAWLYELPDATVLIVTYGCTPGTIEGVQHSFEHSDLAWLEVASLGEQPIPPGYVRAIEWWWVHSIEGGAPSPVSVRPAARRLRSMFADVPNSMSEELLAERRAQAARDAGE